MAIREGSVCLLAGEDPESGRMDDVQHWIRVYAELVASAEEWNAPAERRRQWQERLEFWKGKRPEPASWQDARLIVDSRTR